MCDGAVPTLLACVRRTRLLQLPKTQTQPRAELRNKSITTPNFESVFHFVIGRSLSLVICSLTSASWNAFSAVICSLTSASWNAWLCTIRRPLPGSNSSWLMLGCVRNTSIAILHASPRSSACSLIVPFPHPEACGVCCVAMCVVCAVLRCMWCVLCCVAM